MQKFKDGDKVNVFKVVGYSDKLLQKGEIIEYGIDSSLVLTKSLLSDRSIPLWCLNEDLQLIKRICQIY